jgi:hypothetical protein
MLNVTTVLTSIVCERAATDFASLYGDGSPKLLDFVTSAAARALSAIGHSDALYHNVEHTTHVTLVGLAVLKNKQNQEASVPAQCWANVVVALLCHDIGYVRGLCQGDTQFALTTGIGTQSQQTALGSSDAVLMPVHVNRGKRYIEETYVASDFADIGLINACVERTRFPVPNDSWYAGTADLPGLVRAADLIGQLSDPRYLSKLAAIFYEFEEIGFNAQVGYQRPGDLLTGYPAFFDNSVAPYIQDAADYLRHSEDGRDILEHLYSNLATARNASAAPLRNVANS